MLSSLRIGRVKDESTRRTAGKRRAIPMLPLVIVGMAIVAGLIEPKFLSLDNMVNLARQLVPL